MASLLHAASKGHLQRQCATTPVLIGSPPLAAAEISGVGLSPYAPLSFNTKAICHGAAPEGAEIVGAGLSSRVLLSLNTKAVCLGAAPEGAGMSQRSVGCSSPIVFGAGRQLSANLALNLAPFGRWTLRDKAAQRRLALR